MKSLALVFLMMIGFAAQAAEPVQVAMPFQRLFAIDGFDSNDIVQLTFEGKLPNTCYRLGPARARVLPSAGRIEIAATAYLYDGPCLEVLVPFEQSLEIGPLPPGRYLVTQAGVPGVFGEISIRPATSAAADDFLYAPVAQVWFQPSRGGGRLLLSGHFPASCMRLEEVRVTRGRSAIVVQPIVKVDESRPCVAGSFPFQQAVSIQGVSPGRYALHVRAMNGKATTSLIDVSN